MEKIKRVKVILTVCFVLLAGILYTVSYIKPWKKEAILINDNEEIQTMNDISLQIESEQINHMPEQGESSEEETYIYVHVCGAVKQAGVYQVLEGSRLNDVVECAGGFTKQAASAYINLAQRVVDGQQYIIPTLEEVKEKNLWDDATSQTIASSADIQPSSIEDGRVNLNTASKEELMTLPGVGEAKAEAIIAYREMVSPFQTIEDVMKVSGIKDGLFQKIKTKITVS